MKKEKKKVLIVIDVPEVFYLQQYLSNLNHECLL